MTRHADICRGNPQGNVPAPHRGDGAWARGVRTGGVLSSRRPVRTRLPTAQPHAHTNAHTEIMNGCARRLLADEFFLCAHDAGGHPRLDPVSMGLGLGLALVAELVLLRNIEIDTATRSVVVTDTTPYGSMLDVQLVTELAAWRCRPVRDFLPTVSGAARDRVGQRLIDASLVCRTDGRAATGYRPVCSADSQRAGVRLTVTLRHDERIDRLDLLLLGVAGAVGLDHHLLQGLDDTDRRNGARQLCGLDQAMQCLIAEGTAALAAMRTAVRAPERWGTAAPG